MVHYEINEPVEGLKHKQGKAGLVIAFTVGLVLFAVSAVIAHTHQLEGWQLQIFRWFNNQPNGFRKEALVITEGLGAAYPIAICVLVSALFKKFRLAWRFLFTVAGAFAVAYVIKNIIKEPRPIAMLHGHLTQRAVETGPGFPSGHATAATALALTLWFVLPIKWRWLSVVWILLVVWSRLFLGVHAPVDVIGGFGIGLMAVAFVRWLPKVIAKPLRLDES